MSLATPSRVEVRPPHTSRRVTLVLVTALVVGIGLPLISTAVGLYDHITHWGKLVHAVDGVCATLIFGLLFLAWRDRTRADVTDEFAGLLAMFFGIFFGVMWEVIEFIRDWVAYSDLQKSNTDTMTDFLWNDIAVVLAALVAVRLYRRAGGQGERESLGALAEWLVDGPSRVLDRHGFAMTIVAFLVIGAAIAALWFAGRPVPGLPIP